MGKIIKLEELIPIRNRARENNKKVVFTNGVFDILHRGHVEYLQQSRELGDMLIIGLNTDQSVRIIKGKNRPLVPEYDRAVVLAALECVDYVCMFDEPTPERIIAELVPDVLVKGGDYKINEILGRETVWQAGGEVKVIPEILGISTSNLIKSIIEKYKHTDDLSNI